jgi:hypothetical protein
MNMSVPNWVRSFARQVSFMLFLWCCWSRPGALFAGTAEHQGQVSDFQIQQTIQTKLAKSKIGKDGFRFRVSHGVVTWEGNTNVVQHKGAATRMAKAAGASKVVNNIQVSSAGKAKATQSLKKAAVSEN